MKTTIPRPLLTLLVTAIALLLLGPSCRTASRTAVIPATPSPTTAVPKAESIAANVTSRPDTARRVPETIERTDSGWSDPVSTPVSNVDARPDVRPTLVSVPVATYPEMAREARIEGMTVVDVLVDTNGMVMDARVMKSAGNTWLDASAMEAARQARFTPGRTDGKYVRVWTSIPFKFQLPQPDTLRPESRRERVYVDPPPDIPIVPVDRLDAKPQLLSVPTPTYPEIARKAGIEGQAVVEVLVDTNGTVVDARILKSSGNSLLDASAMGAARGARFTPPKIRGKVVRAFMPIRFQFTKSGEVSWTTD